MSPRAAWRLESLGYGEIFDYMAGQADWLASGLPTEGKEADKPRTGSIARRDVPTCGLDASIDDVKQKMDDSGWDSCLVIDDNSIVFGRIRRDDLDGNSGKTAEDVMDPGPTTVRPSEYLENLVPRMQKQHVDTILVTTNIGQLVGVLRRADAEQRLKQNNRSAS